VWSAVGQGAGAGGAAPPPRADVYFTPQRVGACDGRDMVHVSGNVYHCGVVTGDGEVLMVGDNESGQLGTRLRAAQATPARPRAGSSTPWRSPRWAASGAGARRSSGS
jgi:hypothetical protein